MAVQARTSEAGASTPRALGRIVLACLLALAVGLVVLPLGLGFAQGAAAIEIVNPNDSSSIVVSDKGRAYELTAWTVNAPADAVVTFAIETTEGAATAGPFTAAATAGRPDTFSFEWTIDDAIAEGDYVLEATLSSAGAAVDTATQAFTVNQADEEPPLDPTAAAAETVAISYPVNGGPLGVWAPTGDAPSFVIEGNSSAATDEVAVFYSKSAPGTDPAFESCGTATPEDDGDFAFRCELASGDTASSVTAVAAAANKTGALPLPVDDVAGAADAHTVTAYQQFASIFAVDPATAGGTLAGTCQIFTATLEDQEGRPIAGANVDVHAQGPNDNLKFDVSGTFSDPNQPPNAGAHAAEPGLVCDDNGQGGTTDDADSQGSHAVPGQSSRKHIESLDDDSDAAGTDPAGQFMFALHSASTGETQIVAWADVDGDDLLCDDEPQNYATIGWGVPAPAATGHDPEVPSCVLPSPSPTASASPTASPSISPTVSPSPQPIVWARSITIGFKHKKNPKRLFVKGKVSAEATAPDGCTAGVTVRVQKRKGGGWKQLKTVKTKGTGAYKAKVKDRKGRYRAFAEETSLDAMNSCAFTTNSRRHKHRRG